MKAHWAAFNPASGHEPPRIQGLGLGPRPRPPVKAQKKPQTPLLGVEHVRHETHTAASVHSRPQLFELAPKGIAFDDKQDVGRVPPRSRQQAPEARMLGPWPPPADNTNGTTCTLLTLHSYSSLKALSPEPSN